MAYSKTKWGITEICKGKRNALSIAWDSEYSWDPKIKRRPVMLFTPNPKDKGGSHHIELSYCAAKRLKLWLDAYCREHQSELQKLWQYRNPQKRKSPQRKRRRLRRIRNSRRRPE